MSEYRLEFRDLVDAGDMNMTDFLHVYVSKHFSMNGKQFTAAGRFMSKEECIKASDHMIYDTNRHSFHNWNFDEISVSNRLAFHRLVEIYSKNNLDRMWSDINAVMMDSVSLQDEGMGHGGLLFSDFYNAIQDQADIDPESVSHQLNSVPGNQKDPVFTRWLTVLMANEVFIRHYFTLYFLAIRIKQLNKSGSLAHTYTCQLLALMRIKPAGAKLGELRRLSWC